MIHFIKFRVGEYDVVRAWLYSRAHIRYTLCLCTLKKILWLERCLLAFSQFNNFVAEIGVEEP